MQKAIVIESSGCHVSSLKLNATELNQYFASGWKFVSAAPFGCSASNGGETKETAMTAAILVIIEKL